MTKPKQWGSGDVFIRPDSDLEEDTVPVGRSQGKWQFEDGAYEASQYLTDDEYNHWRRPSA